MRFVKTPKHSGGSVTTKGRYKNSKGKRTNHPKKSETPIEFVGVDGEGINVFVVNADGECWKEHRYVLFGVGESQIQDVTGLKWHQIFAHLYTQYQPGVAYVGFFLGYDFTQTFKTLPEGRAAMLLTSEGRAKRKHKIGGKHPHPVEYMGWQFDILGNKRLRIRPKDCSCSVATCKCDHRPWMYVCDVGSFFQTSFLKVIDPKGWAEGTAVVTTEEYETIKAGKEARSTAVLDNDMRRYNRLENEVLARVMKMLDKGFHEIGVHLPPGKWFGPGQAAQTWLRNIGAPTRDNIAISVPGWFFEAARMSYFGGWFEIMMHGFIPGESHEYDINSAYPGIIAKLPCLLHGTYSNGEGLPSLLAAEREGDISLVYARVWSPSMPHGNSKQYIGGMLHRDSIGRILRPKATQGWYWWHEVKAAQRAGLVKRFNSRGKQQIIKWVKYSPCDCPPPMRSIANLYLKRLEVGKTSPLGKGCKLVYNSAYGKFAQSVGEPMFANPIYASLITAGCRTMILDAIATHPKGRKDVGMVATDAVYFLTPHPGLPISEKLGDWDYTSRLNLTLFKPGVYWDDSTRDRIRAGSAASFKARGINAADFGRQLRRIDDEYRLWNASTNCRFPMVQFPTAFSMVTALQALRRNKWELAGTVTEGVIVTQDSNPSDKRTEVYRDIYDGRTVYRSEPHFGMEQDENLEMKWIPSHPYTKRFGMDDPWSQESQEQFGVTPDGSVVDMMTWVLKGEL
jgi:hypothetical protein